MRNRFGPIKYDANLIFRLRHKAVTERYGPAGSLQLFVEEMKSMRARGGVFQTEVDNQGTIDNMYIQCPEWRQYALMYNDYVLVDGTFRISTYEGVVMLAVVVVDSLGRSMLAGVVFAKSENTEVTRRALQLFGVNQKGATLHSDGALGFSAAANHWKMCHMLCAWHWLVRLPNNIKSRSLKPASVVLDSSVKETSSVQQLCATENNNDTEDNNDSGIPSVRSEYDSDEASSEWDSDHDASERYSGDSASEHDSDDSDRDSGGVSRVTGTTIKVQSSLIKKIQNLVLKPSKNADEFDVQVQELRHAYTGNKPALKQIERLHKDRQRVAVTFTRQHFSAGHNSTGRMEGIFGVVKKEFTPNQLADMRYGPIVEHLTNIFSNRTANSTSEMKRLLRRNPDHDWNAHIEDEWNANNKQIHLHRAEPVELTDNTRYVVTDVHKDDMQATITHDVFIGSPTQHATCNCLSFTSSLIPCVHICCARSHNGSIVFHAEVIAPRWRLSNHPLFRSCRTALDLRVGMQQTDETTNNQDVTTQSSPLDNHMVVDVPVSQNEVQRDVVMRNLLNRLQTESKKSVRNHQLLVAELSALIERSAARLVDNQNQTVTEFIGFQPPTRREVTQHIGRPSNITSPSSLALASIKQSHNSTASTTASTSSHVAATSTSGSSIKESISAKPPRRCRTCRETGHQANSDKCPRKSEYRKRPRASQTSAHNETASQSATSQYQLNESDE